MPSFALVTFGCQMNQHDSERMTEVLEASGWTEVAEPKLADVVVLNTCSVREKAVQKLRSEVGRLGLLKRERPAMGIVVAGCVAQQEGEKLLRRLPQIDLVLGPDNLAELPGLLAAMEQGAPPRVRATHDLESPRFLAAHPRPGKQAPTAFLTTMKGCNERCTFCIVPHTRGSERYRPSREILEEAELLVAAGVRELTLLGQTVNSYRDPSAALPPEPEAGLRFAPGRIQVGDDSEFPALVRALLKRVPDLLRLRYTSPHPRHLTPALVRAHQEHPAMVRHLHLPVQSGSDRVLRRMSRRYTVDEYLERVETLQKELPGVTFSTDVIVGFPGESREDFQSTLDLVERVGFTGVFGFKYSPRPFTPALKLEGEPSEEEKSARLEELFLVADRLRAFHLNARVGQVEPVLVEGPGAEGGYSGRTERNEIVHFGCADDPTGELLPVRITEAHKNSLAGEPSDERRRAPLGATRALRLSELEQARPTPSHRSLPVL